MNKAENLALKKYPEHSVLFVPARRGGYFADTHLREGFIEGYHQAEKDHALTWEDVQLIHRIEYEESRNIGLNMGGIISEQKFYEKVLKRFLETKH